MKLKSKKTGGQMALNKLFLLSALFFAFFTFFGVYTYTIYSIPWFITFFIYELLFFVGLSTGKLVWNNEQRIKIRKQYTFHLTSLGAKVLTVACGISFFCFVYFVYLYRGTIGSFVFGNYTANVFEEGRTSLEKLTLFLMEMGGGATFLICSADNTDHYKKLKLISHITLFLPGIRYLLMGSRFSIAAEFLMLFFVKWPALKARINFSARAKREKRIIVILAVVLGIAFLYLFASRAIYYTAIERKAFRAGDMVMKPFWRKLYDSTNGKIDFICTASDYLGESPYIFAYYCKYLMPNEVFFGQLTFRSILQIVNNLFHIGKSYSELISNMASGQYSGIGYALIADFGIVGSFLFAFLFGRLFAVIERDQNRVRVARTILPAVKVMCFFAPIFYFYVGRLDYTILFCVFLAPLCLRRERNNEGTTY